MFRCFNSYPSSTTARLNILTSKAGKAPPKGHGHGLISRRKRRSISSSSSSSSHPSVPRCVAQERAQDYLACLLNFTGCLHWNWPRPRGHGLSGVTLRGHIGLTIFWAAPHTILGFRAIPKVVATLSSSLSSMAGSSSRIAMQFQYPTSSIDGEKDNICHHFEMPLLSLWPTES
jgi:hypothetical protein